MFPSMVRTLRPLAFAAAALSMAAVPVFAQTSQVVVPNRIVAPVSDGARVTLHGYVSPLANAATDRGAAPDSLPLQGLHLVLKRSATQEATLRQLIAGINQPGSPYYHKWLTPAQFGQQFGPSDQDVATVEAWLSSHGFSVTGLKPGRQVLDFTGNVAQLRSAFGVQIHKYQVNGNVHYATATEPQIPSALAPVVGGFVSLNNFRPTSYAKVLGQATYDPRTHAVQPQWNYGSSSSPFYVVSPQDFGVEYDLPNPALNPGYTGTAVDGSGQTIAIINESNINLALVNQFRSLFGLPANPPTVIIDGNDPGIDGINNPDGPNYASSEAYIDVEWAGAVAPKANIDLVIAADTALESGLFLAAEDAVYNDIAPIMSLSFGACESALGATNAYINNLMEQAAAEGITVMVSTGDSGSAGCDNENTQDYAVNGLAVNGFASTPWNVAVGGTDFYYSDWATGGASIVNYWTGAPATTQTPTESLKAYLQEQPWNGSQFGDDIFDYHAAYGGSSIAGGSGGASSAAICSTTYNSSTGACSGTLSGYPKPAWQSGTGVPADKVRDIPDLSLFASSGANNSFYPFCYADGDCQTGTNPIQISGAGGTSFAAPAFAGIMALIDEQYGPQGQADPILYQLKAQFPAAFHDITVGTNTVPCNLATVSSGSSSYPPTNCIAAPSTLSYTVTDPTYGSTTEGMLASGSTPAYNAAAGYNLATGLGSVDAAQMLADWGSVKLASTSVTLTPSSTSFTHGTAITISGAVTTAGTGTPTGNVALMTDSSEPGQQGAGFGQVFTGTPSTFALNSSGQFSGSVNDLPGGTYDIWGSYSGDSTNAASNSQSTKTTITVNPESSNVVLSLNGPSGTVSTSSALSYGAQAAISAQPVPSSWYTTCNVSSPPASCKTTSFTPATGTVTFTDNGSTINTATLNAEGDAEFNAPFSVGTHSLTASYTGDKSYNPSSVTTPVTFTVNKNTPNIETYVTYQTSSSNPALSSTQQNTLYIQVMNSANVTVNSQGTPVTANGTPVTVPIAAPTGTITITGLPSGSTTSATLAPSVDSTTGATIGLATIKIPAGSATSSSYTMNISYSGDSNYNATSTSSSGGISLPFANPGGTTSTITATMTGTLSPTTSVTISGTVTGKSGGPAPGNANGGVVAVAGGYTVGSASLVPSGTDTSTFSITVNSQTLIQGSNAITVQFLGDATYAPSSYLLSNTLSNPLSDFTMTAANTRLLVPVGGTAPTTSISLTPVNGFSGTVGLGCAVVGSPTGVTCSLNQSSVNLTYSNTASLRHTGRGLDLLISGSGGVLACVLLLGLPARRKAWRNILGMVLFACVIGFGIGCGGSNGAGNIGPIGGGGGGSGTGTPGTATNPSQSVTLTVTAATGATAGTYAVAITGTATASNQIHTLGVTADVR